MSLLTHLVILQINGILLNDKWAEFLKKHHFLVGLSIDGSREVHDRYRVTRSFDNVMAEVEALKHHCVPFNSLLTINRTNTRYPLEVYRFMTQKLGATYVQFNPCVEPVDFKQTAPYFCRDDSIPSTRNCPPSILALTGQCHRACSVTWTGRERKWRPIP